MQILSPHELRSAISRVIDRRRGQRYLTEGYMEIAIHDAVSEVLHQLLEELES